MGLPLATPRLALSLEALQDLAADLPLPLVDQDQVDPREVDTLHTVDNSNNVLPCIRVCPENKLSILDFLCNHYLFFQVLNLGKASSNVTPDLDHPSKAVGPVQVAP